MKKRMLLLLPLIMLIPMLLITSVAADSGTALVRSEEELLTALEDPECTSIEIVDDLEITVSFLTVDKKVTIAQDVRVVYHPMPDPDSFFVKSLEITENGMMTVYGTLETQATFDDNGITIAQIYINGGLLDMTSGYAADNCNFCFNAGIFYGPEEGFQDSVEVNRFFWENASGEQLAQAFAEDVLKRIILQTEYSLEESMDVPEGKDFGVWEGGRLILNSVTLTGSVSVDGGEVILRGDAMMNDIAVPVWAAYTRVTNNEDGSLSIACYDDNDNPYTEEFIDFGNGSGMRNITDIHGQTVWREACDQNGEINFWVHYLNYNYGDDDTWSVDYEAFTDGEHRVGTDYLSGSGDDMLQIAGVYVLDDGSSVREDYAEDQSCMRKCYAPSGELVEVRSIAAPPDWSVKHIWDMTDGSILVLPADTREIGSEAFANIASDKIKLPAGITTLANDAVSEDVLFIIPRDFNLIDRMVECGFSFVYAD